MSVYDDFDQVINYLHQAQHKCVCCFERTAHNGFCSYKCADQAFEEDLLLFASGDMNKAQCEGTKKAPVGSPRQRSFCRRMCGHKKKNTGAKKKSDPDSCLNQSLRRWKCRCS